MILRNLKLSKFSIAFISLCIFTGLLAGSCSKRNEIFVRYDGIYQSAGTRGSDSFTNFYIRFYNDSSVLTTSAISKLDTSSGKPKQDAYEVAEWLNKDTKWGQDYKYVTRGNYKKSQSTIHIRVSGERGDIEYNGYINKVDGNLILGSYSHINRNKNQHIFRFIPIETLK